MNCIAIDDEHLALRKISRYVEKIQYLNLIGTFNNALDAIHFLKENEVHLIFLDIEMDEFTGMDFLESMVSTPYVIITSAYKSYALKGYEYNVIDYLLKPIEFSRFVKASEKAYANFEKDIKLKDVNPNNSNHSPPKNFIFVKEGRKNIKLAINEILYIEGMKDYLQICSIQSRLMILSSFSGIMKLLPENEFIRVHKSFVIAMSKIDSVERNKIYIQDKTIPISASYKIEFMRKYVDYCRSQ